MACDPPSADRFCTAPKRTADVGVPEGRIIHSGLMPGSHKEFSMKMFSQKGVLLFGVMLAVCAFMPSLASAASWSPIGGADHSLFSSNLSFTNTFPVIGQVGWGCNRTEFTSSVVSTNTIEITATGFADCMGTLGNSQCTLTATGGNFPWTATATSTTNVQIHGVDITLVFENTPGNANACQNPATITLTGTLTGGSWNPANNTLNLSDPQTDGLTAHILGAGLTATSFVAGTVRDTAGTLRMFM
jgi:hypothetical protein